MKASAHATVAEELRGVVDLIHDCWFDYDPDDPEDSDIKFDEGAELVTVEYSYEDWDNIARQRTRFLKSTGEVPTYRGVLRINGVEHLEVVDRSGIGGSAFNTIRYDERARRLEILTNFDLIIIATVTQLDISVSVAHERIGNKRITEYLGGLIQKG